MVCSLQDICICYMKTSELSQNYAIAVEPGYIARLIFITRVEESPVVFIHSRCTIKDGNFQRGITCGFHLSRKTFLFGVFEGCICQDPRNLVQWCSEISSKGTPSAISVNRQAAHQDKQVTFMDMLPGG